MQPPPSAAEVRALGHVTVAEVAKRAGMTRGSLYHLWPTQEAYRFDLMRSLHAKRQETPAAGSTVADEVAAAVRVAIADSTYRSSLSFHPYCRSDAASRVMSEGVSVMLDSVLAAIRTELDRRQRKLRDEFGEDHLRSTVSAIIQGVAVIGLMHQQRDACADIDRLVISAQESVDAILTHFTDPAL
jgi:AcrR family transcriptional regulator